jgi:hypothetical protein
MKNEEDFMREVIYEEKRKENECKEEKNCKKMNKEIKLIRKRRKETMDKGV